MLTRRYEFKFVVDARSKDRFLDAARVNLMPDPHGDQARYHVTSLYFDSRDRTCYWEKIDGIAVRSKIRVRFYGNVPCPTGLGQRWAFLEIKHRLNNTIFKERVRLSRAGAYAILEDSRCLTDLGAHVEDRDPSQDSVIETVIRTVATRQYVAANVIAYQREAWIGTVDRRLRLTFDSPIYAYEPHNCLSVAPRYKIPLIRAGRFVMELKFDEVIPRWIRDIIAAQGTRVQRFSKYAAGVDRLGVIGTRHAVGSQSSDTDDTHDRLSLDREMREEPGLVPVVGTQQIDRPLRPRSSIAACEPVEPNSS